MCFLPNRPITTSQIKKIYIHKLGKEKAERVKRQDENEIPKKPWIDYDNSVNGLASINELLLTWVYPGKGGLSGIFPRYLIKLSLNSLMFEI